MRWRRCSSAAWLLSSLGLRCEVRSPPMFWGRPQQILSKGAWRHCTVQQHLKKIERNPTQNCFSGNKPCCCRLSVHGDGTSIDLYFQFQYSNGKTTNSDTNNEPASLGQNNDNNGVKVYGAETSSRRFTVTGLGYLQRDLKHLGCSC